MAQISPLLKFKIARLSKGKEWFIVYYVINPSTQKLHRKKVKLNHIKSIPERKKYADFVIKDINQKLYQGWNPFTEEINPRGYKKIIEVSEIFFNIKERELRKDSIRSYKSYLDILKQWLKIENKSNVACENFKKIDAIDFLDWVYSKRKSSARTYNNYRLFFSTFWNWMKQHQYVTQNHFEKIPKKMVNGKERIIIDKENRERIKCFLEKTDQNFNIICQLVFHTLIRPKEIAHLKPENFDLQRQIIKIPSAVAKSKTERITTIPNSLLEILKEWDFNGAEPTQYIFGTNLIPGKIPVDARRFTKKWDKLRDDLCLDEKMKLYSLRDSGIVQLLQDGVSPEEVMKQAGHSSLEITTVYVKYANPGASEQIKNKASVF